jgi:hypothetical protein
VGRFGSHSIQFQNFEAALLERIHRRRTGIESPIEETGMGPADSVDGSLQGRRAQLHRIEKYRATAVRADFHQADALALGRYM